MSKDFLMKKTVFNPIVDGKAVAVYGANNSDTFDGNAYIFSLSCTNSDATVIGRFGDRKVTVDDVESGRIRLVLLEEPAPVEPAPWEDEEPCPFVIGDLWKISEYGHLYKIIEVDHDLHCVVFISAIDARSKAKHNCSFKDFTRDYTFHSKGDK